MNDRRERLRRLAITRCRECMALLDRPVTDDERRAAAVALGRPDLLPDPQEDLRFDASPRRRDEQPAGLRRGHDLRTA